MTAPHPVVIHGRYQVLAVLGQGAQGQVLHVRDLNQDEEVALKLLDRASGVWNEAQILTALRDDHVQTVRNAAVEDTGQPYLVTELARHGTLQGRIDAPPAPGVDSELAVRWTRQLCQGAARGHDAGLVHADIKPENAFLTSDGVAQLGDWGLASLLVGGRGEPGGTPATMAPEVAAGLAGVTRRTTSVASDVYSLGATLYWLLAGEAPLAVPPGLTRDQILRLVTSSRPPPLRDLAPHVGRALADRVDKAMAHDPDGRYDDAGQFAADLGRLPVPARRWVRTDEDPVHQGCWRGTPTGGGAVVLVCAVPDGKRYRIEAVKLPARRRVRRAERTATPAGLAQALRAAFRTC